MKANINLRALKPLLRSSYRSVLLIALLVAATLDLWLRRPRRGAQGAVWIHKWCRRIVNVIKIECAVSGTPPVSGALVSNHLSYLDILLYSSITPFIMVSKSEVTGWPLLGRLTAQAGTVYVDRDGGPATYPATNQAMAEAYRSGLPVLFFPEGTTTDGAGVLPFRRGLFHSVLKNGIELRTASLRYSIGKENGPATVAHDVCWWGDALFGPHLFRCLGLRRLSARIVFGDAVTERDDRFILSETAQGQVAQAYHYLGRGFSAESLVIPRAAEDLLLPLSSNGSTADATSLFAEQAQSAAL